MPETTKQPDREIGAEEDFGALFERSLKQPKQGEVVTGRVVLIGRDAVTIDIGYKSEGTIPIHDSTRRRARPTWQKADESAANSKPTNTSPGDSSLPGQKPKQSRLGPEIEMSNDG